MIFDKQAYDADSEEQIKWLVRDSKEWESLEKELRNVHNSYPVFVEDVLEYCMAYPEDKPRILELLRRPNVTASDILREECLLNKKHHVNDDYYGDPEGYDDEIIIDKSDS